MSTIGNSIYENLNFASRIYQECNNLADELRREFSTLQLTQHSINRTLKREMRWQEDAQSRGCLYHSMAYSLPLIRADEKADSNLFFQISLAGDGMEASDNREPLIHIGLWECEIDFRQEQYMGFPLFYDAGQGPTIDGPLLRWDNHSEPTWTYSLKLSAINTPDDIQNKIIEPIKRLLGGASATQAFPGGLEGLASYTEHENTIGQYHLSFQ